MTGSQAPAPSASSHAYKFGFPTEAVVQFANLPEVKDGACQATLDDERVVVLGGSPGPGMGYTRQVWELNARTNVWTRYADMISDKQHLGCGVVFDPVDDSPKSLVAAGGYDHPNLLKTVEILDLATNVWRAGKVAFIDVRRGR